MLSQPQIPSNKYGLPVINDIEQFKAATTDTNQAMVLLRQVLRPFHSHIVYATPHNFTGIKLYHQPQLFLRLPAARALARVQDSLLKRGLNILIFDAYRPYAVTEKMWEVVPDDRYAANPANGSGHNRGTAIDLTLADANTGLPLPMPTDFDNFSDTAHYAFTHLPENVLANRNLLRGVMEHFGFVALSTEWWHFSLPDAKRFALLNLSFKQMRRVALKL
ncbi:MAG TPA: M15 family metallopeptidase [Phnomibacter sp.]|nr:M15 family metallopeptidase [Phnomibacter sp.]